MRKQGKVQGERGGGVGALPQKLPAWGKGRGRKHGLDLEIAAGPE